MIYEIVRSDESTPGVFHHEEREPFTTKEFLQCLTITATKEEDDYDNKCHSKESTAVPTMGC